MSKHFEECMLASAEAREIEEELFSVEASVGDLIGAEEVEDMVRSGKTWDFGPSLRTQEMIGVLEKGYIPKGKARPMQVEMVRKPVLLMPLYSRSFRLRPLPSGCEASSRGAEKFPGTTSPSYPQWYSYVEEVLLGLRVLWHGAKLGDVLRVLGASAPTQEGGQRQLDTSLW